MALVEGFPATRPAALSIFDPSWALACVLGDDIGSSRREKYMKMKSSEAEL